MPSLRIALRYLIAKKSHTAVNVISYISMAGIAVAAIAMVCVLSVFNGFTELVAERVSMVDPDIKVSPRTESVIDNADSLAAVLRGIDGVKTAVPTVSSQALVSYGDLQATLNIIGVPENYGEVSGIGSLVIDGEINGERLGLPGALLSVGAANNLGARPDPEQPLYLTVPRRLGRINPAFPMAAFTTDTLVVCGVYQTNQAQYDTSTLFIPLDHARELLDYETESTAIEIGVTDPQRISQTKDEIAKALGEEYIVADRLEQQAHSFRMISIEKWITFLMLFFVLVMASFNILSSMSMLIIEKEESLRILSSFGAPLSMLRRIFLYQGILVAAGGGVIGIAIGVLLCLLQQSFGLITIGGDHSQMSIINYPCVLRFTDVLVVALCVLVIGLISGFIASRSVKMANIEKKTA